MQIVRMAFLILIGGIFSLNAMQAPRKSRLMPGIYLREIVNNTDQLIKISSVALEFAPDIFGFRALHNENDDYITTPLKGVGPGKKTWTRDIFQIPFVLGVGDNRTLAGAQLKIETGDSAIDEHYWLIREWNMDGTYEFNIKRRPLKGKSLVQISHEKKSFAPDKPLITFVKIIVDKLDLLGVKMVTQTSKYKS